MPSFRDTLRHRERHRHTGDEQEQREDEILKVKARPVRMLELIDHDLRELRARQEALQHRDHRAAQAENPAHVEPTQGIE